MKNSSNLRQNLGWLCIVKVVLSCALAGLMVAEFVKTLIDGESSPVWYAEPMMCAVSYVSTLRAHDII